jgi:hypothetical protein
MNMNQQDLTAIFAMLILGASVIYKIYDKIKKNKKPTTDSKKRIPISVNYHFSRKCNYTCGFCFHTAKNSNILSLEKAKEGLEKLKKSGMRKISFCRRRTVSLSEISRRISTILQGNSKARKRVDHFEWEFDKRKLAYQIFGLFGHSWNLV